MLLPDKSFVFVSEIDIALCEVVEGSGCYVMCVVWGSGLLSLLRFDFSWLYLALRRGVLIKMINIIRLMLFLHNQ